MAKVFFGSAIDDVAFCQIQQRYEDVEKTLRARGHILLNPASVYTDTERNVRDSDAIKGETAVVTSDLQILKDADVLLVDASDLNHQYVGCICEMVYARVFGIPVIAFLGPNNPLARRAFFSFHCSEMTEVWEEALSAVDRVLS